MTRIADRPLRLAADLGALFAGDCTVSGDIVGTSVGSGRAWADEVVASLREGERAVVSLPFAPGAEAVAHRVALRPSVPSAAPSAGVSRQTVTERPTSAEYAANVRTALGLIAAGQVQKVVLGRGLDVVSDPPLDPAAVLARLLADRPGRYVFGVPLGERTDAPTLIGASPELLVRRRGAALSSLPLAGSAPRVVDPAEDGRRAQRLLDSAKDLAEHEFVVRAILSALEPVSTFVAADPRPRLVSTDTLHHLGTRIEATLAPSGRGASALHLAQLLHPTPAVGGVPIAPALGVIGDLEPDRGPLTGAVGWVDGSGDGEFAVTIRAGVLDGPRLRLYAGAGIVAGSDPESEVRETGAKLATMLKAVGL